MKLLALDTSTEACSCALLCGEEVLSREADAPRRHAELILPMIDELLSAAGVRRQDLDGLSFGRGPGGFTGLRIACGVVQGLALGLDLPIAPVSSLQGLAQRAQRLHQAEQVLAGLDARMQEVYWGLYALDADGLMQLQGEEVVCASKDVPLPAAGAWFGAGSAWLSDAETLNARCAAVLQAQDADLLPMAVDLLPAAARCFAEKNTVSAEQAIPTYLRNNVVQRPGA